MNDSALIVLHVRCVSCRAAATLHFIRWPEQSDRGFDRSQEWTCPYCKASNHGTFQGNLIRAEPWYDPETRG